MAQTLNSDPVNPLRGLVGPALFPNTIRVSTDASLPVDSTDLESVHNFMKSLEMKIPEKALEEAWAIVDNGTELLNTKFTSFVQSMGINGDLATKGKEKPQERRPGLGRKRPVFTLKPSASQRPVSLGPSLDIDQITDPAELFAAVERIEEAEKEIKRQRSISIHDIDVNNPPANTRRRRPGILGKTVRHKHRFSFAQSETDDAFMVSQGSPGRDILAEHNSQLPQETSVLNVELQEADFTGSIKLTENRINGILDELLSEDLEQNMVLSKLQERLQIKPIELGPLVLPDFPMTGKTDAKTVGERIEKPKKFSLELHNLVKRTTEGTPSTHSQPEKSAANNIASPTPAKSSFASLSLLKKRILQSNPLRDPFSPLNINLQAEDPPDLSVKMNSECLSYNVVPTESQGETENLAGLDSRNMALLRDSDFSPQQLMEKNSDRDSVKTLPSGSQFGMEQQNCHDDIDANIDVDLNTRNMDSHHESDGLDKVRDISVINNDLKDQEALETYVNCQKMQDGKLLTKTLPSLQEQGKADDTANCSIETPIEDFGSTAIDRQIDNMLPETTYSAEKDHHFVDPVEGLNSDQLNPVAVEVHSTKARSELPEMSPQHHAQAKGKRQKAKRCTGGRRERKALKPRPSLADAGTSFEDGVRRSKRTKTRPLEFWKGERLLFGRVNESVKLVGVKYLSPAQGSLKVKSYISDDYKDIVEVAARY